MTMSNDLQLETYRRMLRIRAFEKAVEKLIKEGEVFVQVPEKQP